MLYVVGYFVVLYQIFRNAPFYHAHPNPRQERGLRAVSRDAMRARARMDDHGPPLSCGPQLERPQNVGTSSPFKQPYPISRKSR